MGPIVRKLRQPQRTLEDLRPALKATVLRWVGCALFVGVTFLSVIAVSVW